MRSLTILFATLLSLTSAIVADDKTADLGTDLAPAVLARAKEIHADFKGQEGYIAQFGDSITYSMAFWSPFWEASCHMLRRSRISFSIYRSGLLTMSHS